MAAPTDLLARLTGLPYAGRIRLLVSTVRVASDPGALLMELVAGEPWQRHLAVIGASITGDADLLYALTLDRSRWVSRSALPSWMRRASAEQILALYDRSAPTRRREIRSGAIRQGRRDLGPGLFDRLLAAGDRDAAGRALQICDDDAVRTRHAQLTASDVRYHNLSPWRPELVFELLEQALARCSGDWDRTVEVWARFSGAVDDLLRWQPARITRLFLAWPADTEPAYVQRQALDSLLTLTPEVARELLGRPGWMRLFGHPGLSPRRARRLEPELIFLMAELLVTGNQHGFLRWLGQFAPSTRAEIFEELGRRRDLSGKIWSLEVLEILPTGLRQTVAARQQTLLPEPHQEGARDLLDGLREPEHTVPAWADRRGDADATVRAAAWTHSLGSLRRARGGLGPLRDALDRLRNDQDPVRRAALDQLARWPLSKLEPGDLSAIQQLCVHALQARDTSQPTLECISRFAERLLTVHAQRPGSPGFQAGLDVLRGVLTVRPHQARLFHHPRVLLPLPAAERFAAHLTEHADVRTDLRGMGSDWCWVAQCLGRRAWEIELVQSRLWAGIQRGLGFSHWVGPWLEDPSTRAERTRQLLEFDPSAYAIAEVEQQVHLGMQHLLDPYLTGTPVVGRFYKEDGVYRVPRARRGFERWLPRQQHALAAILDRVIRQPEQSVVSRRLALEVRGRLLVTTLDDLRPLASSGEVAIAEAALQAMSSLDLTKGVLAALGEQTVGDRARVAMYAMRRVGLRVRSDGLMQALEVLAARPRNKITVEKELLRLAVDLGGDRGWALLQRYVTATSRDVRRVVAEQVATVLTMRGEAAWTELERLASDPEADVVAAVASRLPLSQLDPAGQARALRLLDRISRHSDARPRADALRRLGQLDRSAGTTVAEGAWRRRLEALCDPSETEWTHALAGPLRPAVPSELTTLLVQCAASSDQHVAAAGLERLDEYIARLRLERISNPNAHQQLLSSLPLRERLGDASAAVDRVVLALLDHADRVDTVDELVRSCPPGWRRDGVMRAVRSGLEVPTGGRPEVARALMVRWRDSDAELQHAALLLAEAVGVSQGWPAITRDTVQYLRRHAAPAVRLEARRWWLPAVEG